MNLSLPVRAAFYYVWYPQAWSLLQNNGVPETVFHPTLGVYASADPAVIDQQAAWAIRARLDALIVSWWGQGPGTDAVLEEILARAAGGNSPATQLQYAIYYEQEAYQHPPVSQIVADLQYLAAHAFGQPNYLHIGGKPVVFVYGANAPDSISRWVQAKAALGGNLYLSLDTSARGSGIDSWHGYQPTLRLLDNRPFSMTASPGFHRYSDGYQPLDRNPIPFTQALQTMVSTGVDWQLVSTWNEWGEGTSVEPCSEFGTTYLDMLTANFPARQPTCVPWGQPCSQGQVCCLGSCVNGTCYVPDGGSCQGNPNLCIPGHVCLGDICHPYNPSCTPLGGFCFQGGQCCSGLCQGQRCVGQQGDACLSVLDCGSGLACLGGLCQPPCGQAGQPCCLDGSCGTGLLCGPALTCVAPMVPQCATRCDCSPCPVGQTPSCRLGACGCDVAVAPLLTIDVPVPGQSLSGTVVLGGWALDPLACVHDGVDRLLAFLDGDINSGVPLTPVTRVARPDVAAIYGSQFAFAGYQVTWDSTTVAPGPHTITFYAHGGISHLWANRSVDFVVAPPVGCTDVSQCPLCPTGQVPTCIAGVCGCLPFTPPCTDPSTCPACPPNQVPVCVDGGCGCAAGASTGLVVGVALLLGLGALAWAEGRRG